MKTKAYIGNCPNCGRECMSGLKTTSCWNCETEFTIPTDMQEISYVNSTSIESKGCDNEKEPCDDSISRQAVMDALCDGCELFHRNGEQVCLSKCEEYHFLVTLPPVTPQPKTGHWIYSKAVNTGEIIFSECSVCGNGESRCAKRMKYCPNCGTKMVEPQESEEQE